VAIDGHLGPTLCRAFDVNGLGPSGHPVSNGLIHGQRGPGNIRNRLPLGLVGFALLKHRRGSVAAHFRHLVSPDRNIPRVGHDVNLSPQH